MVSRVVLLDSGQLGLAALSESVFARNERGKPPRSQRASREFVPVSLPVDHDRHRIHELSECESDFSWEPGVRQEVRSGRTKGRDDGMSRAGRDINIVGTQSSCTTRWSSPVTIATLRSAKSLTLVDK
jgi:hypothetical protein